MPPAEGTIRQIVEQVRDPMVMVLLAAAALTIATGDHADTAVISLVVVMNTAVGVVQHHRAERAVAALRDLAPRLTTALRDGVSQVVSAAEVVPGDLLLLGGGDIVPADGTLEVAEALTLDESAMTGESLPVLRRVRDDLSAGTLVVRGRGELTVTTTGANSGLGRLATLVHEAPQLRTPLQERMRHLSSLLVVGVLLMTAVVVILGLVRGEGLVEMLVVGASLAVAAVPESLPAVMTVALAAGAHRMAGRSAVVRRLASVETLGSVSVIATDKTGTLTRGSLSVEHLWPDDGDDLAARRDLMRDLVLCNDAEPEIAGETAAQGEPLEVALLEAAARGGVDLRAVRATWRRSAEVPFDAATQCMTTVHHGTSGWLTIVKGAPERVLDLVPEAQRVDAAEIVERWAAEGCRVLAVAHAPGNDVDPRPGTLELAGLVAFADPPREAAADVVAQCHDAGVRVVLVTGDHLLTAQSIARKVGIPTDDEDGTSTGSGPSVFARVRPEEKVQIVEALRAHGEVVAMIGDGVNDAPALKRSDIGVAAGRSGTEVARQAADLVLLDDDLSTVVAAIEEGRRIFANLRAFLVYAVSGGLSEVAVMLLGPAVGMPLALLPSQILWINLLTHGLTGVAFSGEPADPEDMRRPPVPRSASILQRRHGVLLAAAAATLAVSSLVAGLAAGHDHTRTAVFLTLGLGQLGVALSLRAPHAIRGRSALGLPAAVFGSAGLLLLPLVHGPLRTLLGTTSLTTSELLVALGAAAVPGLVTGTIRLLGSGSRGISGARTAGNGP